jgi:hypothetical protein
MCTAIADEEVSPMRPSPELEWTVVEHQNERDGVTYVSEACWYSSWAHIRKYGRYIVFSWTHRVLLKGTTLQSFELGKKFNGKLTVIATSAMVPRLVVDQSLKFHRRTIRDPFNRSCRVFRDPMKQAFVLLDSNKVLLLPRGESKQCETIQEDH